VIVHITPGPSERTVTDRLEEKWCFGCKRRGLHRLVVLSDPFPSYYEPVAVWECPTCGRDRTDFGDARY
jgi:hypothetical protein